MKLELESTAATVQNPFAARNLSNNGYDDAAAVSARINEMLKAGIAAAKEGNRAEARVLLMRVTESQSDNETAWLWLASISEYPEELLVFLNNVLSINPDNERALEWSRATKSLLAKTFVQRGINASRESHKDLASQFFQQALSHDSENEMAWLWLASIADSEEEKMSYLERVLALNPENETARASVKAIKQQMSQSLLKRANVAAISGDHESARSLLDELMNLSPEMEEAWILKAYLSEGHEEKITCFERVLTLNPENETARAGIDSLNALRQRELERIGQKVDLEKLQAAAIAVEAEFNQPETDENIFEEVPEQLFFAEQSAAQNQFAALEEEYPDFNFSAVSADAAAETEEEDDIHRTYTATEENQIESDFLQDGPTQELEEDFVNSLAVQTAFSREFQPIAEEEREFFAPEIPANDDALESDSEFSFQLIAEDEPAELAAETETSEAVQAEISSESAPAEAFQSKDFEIMMKGDFSFAEDDFSFGESVESSPAASNEESLQTNFFAAETRQNSAVEFSEYVAANDLTNESFAPASDYNHYPAETCNAENDFRQALPQDAGLEEASEVFSQAPFGGATESEILSVGGFENEDDIEEICVSENVTLENYFQSSFETKTILTQQREQETGSVSEQFINETETEKEEAAVGEQKTLAPQPASFDCPFCSAANEEQSFVCQSCCAVLTLSDLEMLLSNQNADRDLLANAIGRMEGEALYRTFEEDELIALGIAHLNAKNLRQGFNYLQQASQLNHNNVVLSGQVNALAIRLDEIEQHESKSQEAKSCTILVVDDSPTVRKLISGKLEKSGHTVILAVDGMDALAKIGETVPDLVLLDITMPRMDGYQVCKLIRNNNLTKDVPVVMISGKDGFFDKVRGRMAGSTGYITKPFGPDTLMRTIDSYLN